MSKNIEFDPRAPVSSPDSLIESSNTEFVPIAPQYAPDPVTSNKLTYSQLASSVNPSFWSKLTDLKLNVDKLEENDRHIWGYSQMLGNSNMATPLLEVDSTSFNENFSSQNMYIPFQGKIINKNTIEQFKECDKMDLINKEGMELYEKIQNGEALKKPSILNKFLVLSFADLKKYHYYYWFAYPVPNLIVGREIGLVYFREHSLVTPAILEETYNQFKYLEDSQKSYFMWELDEFLVCKIHTLEKIKSITETTVKKYVFCFYNTTKDDVHLPPQLRNYVLLILKYCPFLKGKLLRFLAFNLERNDSKITCGNSQFWSLLMPETVEEDVGWVGWEKNERDKMGPRMANMKKTLDPQILAENAIDLNLKLMKWRILPNINLEKIKETKCLLLGSGTLGCSVGRNLLAWGVRNITFVDNSTVSFSNPVRQSLFTYENSVNMTPKAEAAAEALKKVFPGVNSKGVNLNVPMPGHSVGATMLAQTKENVEKLTELIKEHDVIFLLMDSRESRWLPTVLGSYFNKVVINAALGFDSYLVIRHGAKTKDDTSLPEPMQTQDSNGYKIIHGSNLGCYFCNDVTAPGNSTHDRTLDQQCTVTRPGVSHIASALATELAVSLLQHNDGTEVPAFYKLTNDAAVLHPDFENQCVLGLVPHSIRGFLSSFTQVLPATMKFDQCIACSEYVLHEYEKDGFEFLLKVFNSSKYLEDVTHLTEMFKDMQEQFSEILACDSDDDFE